MAGNSEKLTRRGLLRNASLGLGASVITAPHQAVAGPQSTEPAAKANRLPREVWVASISQERLEAKNYEEMIKKMLGRMEEVVSYEPDIVCLPEAFPFVNLPTDRPPLDEVAEVPIGPVSGPFAEFAKKHNCYVVCPIYTKHDGRYYNAAVFIDRAGKLLGEYHKIHPTIGEIEGGIVPGSLEPPVFKTDFGVIGSQICFDIEWFDGWQKLRKAGAEMVFWPSAFAGGSMVNTKAWENKYCVVSSTRKGTTKICDISGETIAWTGNVANWVCAPLNLEKVLLHTWPYCQRFNDIHAKYGRKVRIKTFYEEEWTIIESRSADVKVADVMKEFELDTHEEHIQAAEAVQKKYWQ
jgi:predicted amidohydrolase